MEVKSGKEGRIRNLSDGGKYNMLRSMMQVFVKNSMEADLANSTFLTIF